MSCHHLEGRCTPCGRSCRPCSSEAQERWLNIASVHAFDHPRLFSLSGGQTRVVGTDAGPRDRVRSARHSGERDRTGLYRHGKINRDYWAGFPDPEAERRRAADLHPPRRLGRPEEVAMTAVFLASDEAPFINASVITIDGGRSVMYHD